MLRSPMDIDRQSPPTPGISIVDCRSDAELIALWLQGKSLCTQQAYRSDIAAFEAFLDNKTLAQVKVDDLAAFTSALQQQGYAVSSLRRRLYAVKSLLSFATKVGYLSLNPSHFVTLPKKRSNLSDRILSETEVLNLIALEPKPRNRIMLRFLYETGCRVGEMCQLKWRNLKPRHQGAQVDLWGKGGKMRSVLISPKLWMDLQTLRTTANAPVFATKSGRHFALSNVVRIVKAAAKRAGNGDNVSPHWLRHAHASHSLDRGAPLHLVQATLGHSSIATTERYLHARPDESSSQYLP
ncbi:MAG: tyrosine-type recombinase/integrase [Jaaginema sp. PMC 1079.18]|nr:tyrosine-type recombinase/integrase [Jaaginema sp. PMC 1080.18]MEC4853722.1 tyrosine-type recombinase/integrase [Jaaginema sp. PMC 1079.18]MEC4866925.1 tyrosine-type recombinase/integrase [Jaaginema sp. PMC 1078.18]